MDSRVRTSCGHEDLRTIVDRARRGAEVEAGDEIDGHALAPIGGKRGFVISGASE